MPVEPDTRRIAISEISEVDQKWRALLTEFRAGRLLRKEEGWNGPILERLKLRRLVESLIDPKIGLGLHFRWKLAFELIRHEKRLSSKELCQDVLGMERHFFQLGTSDTKPRSQLRHRVSLHEKAQNRASLARLCKVLTATFGAQYPDGLGRAELTTDDFLRPAHGPLAVCRFVKLLRNGCLPIGSNGAHIPAEEFFPSAERATALSTLWQQLEAPHGGRPIQGVYMPGSPTGLCAVAHHILNHFEHSETDTRPVLLLPCSRRLANHAYRGLDFLVHHVRCFFEQTEAGSALPNLSSEELASSIERIRTYMAHTPAIIVLVGHEVTQGAHANLRRAIRDEPVVELLSYLVHPCVDNGSRPSDASQIQRSYVILLADGPVDVLRPYCQADIRFPQPPRMHNAALRPQSPYKAHHQRLIDEGLRHLPHVPSEDAIRGYVQLLELEEASLGAPQSRLHELCRYETSEVPDKLANILHKVCDPLELLLLRIIAITGSGVARNTLWRCAQLWKQAVNAWLERVADGAQIAPHSAKLLVTVPDASQRDVVIDSLKAHYPHILFEGEDEPRPDLDPALHPYEYPDFPARTAGFVLPHSVSRAPVAHGEKSLEISYPELRAALLRELQDEQLPWPAGLLHQIICSEALRQQQLLLRHAHLNHNAGWRAFRRAFEALYHGLLSLPSAQCLTDAVTWPHVGDRSTLPNDPIARFRFLYAILFRQVIEGGPRHRMSRQWAADDVKFDICLLAQSCFGAEAIPGRPYADSIPSAGAFATLPAWKDLASLETMLEEHYMAAAIAVYRANDRERWPDVAAGFKELAATRPLGKHRSAIAFHEKREFDMAVVRHGPIARETMKLCEHRIQEFGISPRMFDSAPWSGPDPSKLTLPTSRAFEQYFSDLSRLGENIAPERQTNLADWLMRLADIRYRSTYLSDGPAYRWRGALETMAMLKLAVALRHLSFAHDPFYLNSHLPASGMETLAHTSLDALRLLLDPRNHMAQIRGQQEVDVVGALLAGEARLALDWYTLSAASNAPDRVTMLILESRFSRTAGALAGRSGLHSHQIALQFLKRAESGLLEFRSQPFFWLRLLIERCAVLRNLAMHLRNQHDKDHERVLAAKRFISLAMLDVTQVGRLVDSMFDVAPSESVIDYGSPWRRIVSRQRKLIEEEGKNHVF